MKAKVESERKRLREEKDLAAEEKSHIQVELEKHEKELAEVRSLTQLFSVYFFMGNRACESGALVSWEFRKTFQ